jgi:hypothetical protein
MQYYFSCYTSEGSTMPGSKELRIEIADKADDCESN